MPVPTATAHAGPVDGREHSRPVQSRPEAQAPSRKYRFTSQPESLLQQSFDRHRKLGGRGGSHLSAALSTSFAAQG